MTTIEVLKKIAQELSLCSLNLGLIVVLLFLILLFK